MYSTVCVKQYRLLRSSTFPTCTQSATVQDNDVKGSVFFLLLKKGGS